MFQLRSQSANEGRNCVAYGLLNNKTYTIGRDVSCDIKVSDKSVSKRHAEITLQVTSKIKDLKSTNCTVLNGVALKPQTEYDLQPGSMIQLGRGTSFVFQREQLTVSSTSLPSDERMKLREMCELMGYKLVETWSSSITHVIVPAKLVLTRKVVHALIAQQHIVTMSFFTARQRAIDRGDPLPSESVYTITSWEDCMHPQITIDYAAERQSLFRGKVFVFPSRNAMQKMSMIIQAAGGTSTSTETAVITQQDIATPRQEYLLVVDEDFTQSQNAMFNELVRHAKAINRRLIPDKEIPLAVVYASTDRFCNSRFDKTAKLIANMHPCISGVTIVPETQVDLVPKSSAAEEFAVEDSQSSHSFSSTRAYHECDNIVASLKIKEEGGLAFSSLCKPIIPVDDEADVKPAIETERMTMKRCNREQRMENAGPSPWASLPKSAVGLQIGAGHSASKQPRMSEPDISIPAKSIQQVDKTSINNSKRKISQEPDVSSSTASSNRDIRQEKRIRLTDDVVETIIPRDSNVSINISTANMSVHNMISKRFKKKRIPTYASIRLEITTRIWRPTESEAVIP